MIALNRSVSGCRILLKFVTVCAALVFWALVIMAILAASGCAAANASGGISNGVAVGTLTAARLAILTEISPRIEQALARGTPYPVYLTMRQEEHAALDALGGLRAKALRGEQVTQAEFSTALTTFMDPLELLVNQYVPTQLPATQPARP